MSHSERPHLRKWGKGSLGRTREVVLFSPQAGTHTSMCTAHMHAPHTWTYIHIRVHTHTLQLISSQLKCHHDHVRNCMCLWRATLQQVRGGAHKTNCLCKTLVPMLHGYKQLLHSVEQTFNLFFYVQFQLYPVPLPVYYLPAYIGTSVKASWPWSYLKFIYKLGSRGRCQARVRFVYSCKVEQTLFRCLWSYLFPLSGLPVTGKGSASFQKVLNKEWARSVALWDSKWLNNPCFKLPNTVC